MNKNAYLAELSQLLYYMTPWDRDAAVEDCRVRFDSCDDPDALLGELGSPMKLAVTLHRTYTPTPQPGEGETAPSPLPSPSAAEVPEPQEEPEPEPEPCDEPAEPEEPEVPEEPEEPEVPEETPAPAGEAPNEEIFSEIFNAATLAQSAVFTIPETPAAVERKARPGVLIPYAIACVVLGIPVSVLLFAVDVVIFAIAVAALAGGVYFFTLLVKPQFPTFGDKLVVAGIAILAVTAALAIGALGVWFFKNAAVGFSRFLVAFGRKHGYREEAAP